jgi:hypothetical protein
VVAGCTFEDIARIETASRAFLSAKNNKNPLSLHVGEELAHEQIKHSASTHLLMALDEIRGHRPDDPAMCIDATN